MRPVHPIAIELPRLETGDEAVKDVGRALRQGEDLPLSRGIGAVEEAKIDARRLLGEEGEIDAYAVVGRAEGVWFAGPDSCGHSFREIGVIDGD
jgi:hypothetical protein